MYLCVNSNLQVRKANSGSDFAKVSASDASHEKSALLAQPLPAAAPTEQRNQEFGRLMRE
jgi:hypothetical protein